MACGGKLLCACFLFAHAAAASSAAFNIAVYWGQADDEGSLADACNSGNYAYVVISFLDTFGKGLTPALNLAGHCDAGSGNCTGLTADIRTCQSQGIKVLLSLGGGGGNYGLESSKDVKSVASYLWDNFLGGSSLARPLGAAVLDGIDFFIEFGEPAHYDDLANALRAKGQRQLLLTAAPQCTYPDASIGPALQVVQFDIVWVQFRYNPSCQYATGGNDTNLVRAWKQWTSSVKAAKFYLGLDASDNADVVNSGYIPPSYLKETVIPAIRGVGNFGGIMLWSRYYDGITGYSVKLKSTANPPISSPVPRSSVGAPPVGSTIVPSTGSRRKKRIRIYIIAGTSSISGVCIILFTFFLWYKKYYGKLPWQRGSRNAPRIESFLQKQETSYPKRYTYSEVRKMTKSLSQELGHGGYGAVYRGNLPDGREIAVKMLKDTKGDGEEFMNEVGSISRTSHINVVSLLGFCLQGSKRALIYEYMPNGSLEKYTFGSNSVEGDNGLTWERLFDIVIEIARGLEYLHNGCNTRIVHFDIKPQNILLDQDFRPKISDFGLAKLCQQKESKISIAGARGTIGYIAPEVFSRIYGNSIAVSSKSDVYSYGMVVLEMVGARKQIEVSTESSNKYFPQWLYDNLDQFCRVTCEISSETMELVRKMTIVGLWCVQFAPADRPSMSKVLEMLESSIANLQLPPKGLLSLLKSAAQEE